jgi:hypothetical protein
MSDEERKHEQVVRLGKLVRARRLALGLTQDAVQAAGGPSDRRQTAIELGRLPVPTPFTLAKVDRVLRWEAGSAERVLEGGEPTELDADVTALTPDMERAVALEVALSRVGVKPIAARDHSPAAGSGYQLPAEVVDQIIEVLNSIPPASTEK